MMVEKIPGIFSPSIADTFHANFIAINTFLAQILRMPLKNIQDDGTAATTSSGTEGEQCSTTVYAYKYLYDHPATTIIRKKWSSGFSIYLKLREQQAGLALESALGQLEGSLYGDNNQKKQKQSHKEKKGEKMLLDGATSVLAVFPKCTGTDWLIPELSAQFFELSLKLLQRLVQWSEEVLEKHKTNKQG